MSSHSRRIFRRSGVTSPRMRTAKPGPGKGWRCRTSSGMPRSRPILRTSSLNKSLSGSISLSFILSGRPPTLWWVLMVCDGPRTERDSITSGYSVPCTSHSTLPSAFSMRCASSSKTAMNSLPMILRLVSGSVTPASLLRKRSVESTATRRSPRLSRRPCCTFSNSFLRRTPLFTNTQVSREEPWSSRMARSTSVAATAESTPPERAQIARPSPTVWRTLAMVASIKCWAVQVGFAPQIFSAKLRKMSVPDWV